MGSPDLCALFESSGFTPPAFLLGMAYSTGNYEPGGGEQNQYGGQDVRRGMKKGFQTVEERDAAKRFTGFAKDAYGQGSEEQAHAAAASIGPSMPGSYEGAAAKGKGKGKGGKGGKGGKDSKGGSERGAQQFGNAQGYHQQQVYTGQDFGQHMQQPYHQEQYPGW